MIAKSIHQKVDHVYSQDPALERAPTAEEMKAFREQGADALPLKPGMKPAIFHLMSLSRRAYKMLSQTSLLEVQRHLQPGTGNAIDLAFFGIREEAVRFGLVGALGLQDSSGGSLRIETEETRGAGRAVTQASMDDLFAFGPGLINELGALIIELSEVPPT